MIRLLPLIAVVLISTPAMAQSAAAARPAFDVAGIQVSTRANPGVRGGILRGNRYELRNATMVDLIVTAYGVQPERISGGPSWLEWSRWDIAALAPEGTPPPQLREMLKTLLADRFQLVARRSPTARHQVGGDKTAAAGDGDRFNQREAHRQLAAGRPGPAML